MPIDAYDPCPCGSGKKFKFCCAAAAEEIDKVHKYQEHRQTQSSLQVLDKLLATKPELAWGYITKASILLNESEYTAARETLIPLLEKSPDHPFGIALYATAAFASAGYEISKPAIYRAFQRCSSAFPDIVGSLSMGIAAWMFAARKYMGCRQYLGQAIRLVPDQDKQDIFLRLLEFDSNGDLPYPLRSVHSLAAYAGPESAAPELKEEIQRQVHRAESLVAIGCFEPAADAYRHLAERDPEAASLWQNAGFCAAWDGNETAAAETLHRAAKLYQDSEAAVECETLAQLLDLNQPEAHVPVNTKSYRVRSVARVLTLLDQEQRFARLPELNQSRNESKAVEYAVLDRLPLPEDPNLWPEADAIPNSIAQIGVFSEAESGKPQVFLTGLNGEPFDSARELFESFASELIESAELEEDEPSFGMVKELAPMLFTWHFPNKMPVIRQTQLEDRRWEQNIRDIWPNTPLEGLGGKTPNAAQGDPALEIPLRAAIFVLDAFCEQNGHLLDVPALCEQFGVAPPAPIDPQPGLPLQSFSAMQLHRLKIPELSDEQLTYVLNRVMLIHHSRFLHDVLLEVLSRPTCAEKVKSERTYFTLMQLAQREGDRDETYRWIQEGLRQVQNEEHAFEKTFRWELRELTFRAEDPGDPNLIPLVTKLVRKYAKKLPQFLNHIVAVLESYGIEPPANLAEIAAEETGSVSTGGIWTPGEESEETVQKKIWLPGQS